MILEYAECPFHELQALKLSQRLLLKGFGFLSDWAEIQLCVSINTLFLSTSIYCFSQLFSQWRVSFFQIEMKATSLRVKK